MATAFSVLFLLSVCNCQWVEHSEPELPRRALTAAAGYYNDSIYYFGGELLNSLQLVEYDISSDTMSAHEQNYLTFTQYGSYTGYTQYRSTVYTLFWEDWSSGASLFAFNLQQMSYEALDSTLPIHSDSGGCLASSAMEKRLYIAGGANLTEDEGIFSMDDVQVLDLDTTLWVNNVSAMQYSRWSHSCIVANNELYVVGKVSAVEVIDTFDIERNSWHTLDDTVIPDGLYDTRVVDVGGVIFVVGGRIYSEAPGLVYVDTVYTIDTATGRVRLSPDALPYSSDNLALVAVDNIIYGFGGLDKTNKSTHWMSYSVPDSTAYKPVFLDSVVGVAICMILMFLV